MANNKKLNSIAIAGNILVDKINSISAYPKMGKLVEINKISNAVGGCVPNVAIDIKRLFPSFNVTAVGKIGNDGEGAFVKETLMREGIDCSGIKLGERTGFTDVMSVEGGERTFFTYSGGNASFGYDDIDFDNLNVEMFHLGYFLLLDKIDIGDGIKILKELKNRGIKTSIDLVSKDGGNYSVVLPALQYTDNLIINEIEAQGIANVKTDDLLFVAKKIKELGVSERVIIHQPTYACCLSNEGYTIVPSLDLPKGFVKGTTGAGDAFCAGALIGIANNLTDKEILELASISAVCNLSEANSIDGMRTFEEAKKLCSNFKRKDLGFC